MTKTDLMEKKCAMCGRKFLPAVYHIFKKNGRYYCKWSCYKKMLDAKEAVTTKKGEGTGHENKSGQI